MKGIQGLILAIGLGVAGALFNFAYLNAKAQEVRLRGVVGVAKDKDIERGETITAAHLEEVQVPENVYERLKQYTVPWETRRSVIDMPAARSIHGGDLILKEDTTQSAWQMNFSPTKDGDLEERGMPIPVDGRSYIPSLYRPGDMIEFIVSRYRVGVPTLAKPPAAKTAESGGDAGKTAAKGPGDAPADPSSVVVLGPFKILAVGNRLGDAELMRSSHIPQMQENVITIKVTKSKSTFELDPEAQKLWNLLQSGTQQISVLMVPRGTK